MDDKEKDLSREPAREEADLADEAQGETASPSEEQGNELTETRSRLAYLAAEFDNYRKRAAREKEALVAYGNERILRAILPFLDNLERAMALAATSGTAEGLLSGVRLTYDQFLAELRKFGLEQISAEGEMFDPTRHEAIAQVPWKEKPEGTVLAAACKGYLLNGRLLRPAQVTVAQAPGTEPDPERGNGRETGDAGREN
jgi:molecular chaperone GrpE